MQERFVAIGPRCFGIGSTINRAKAQCRKAGGEPRSVFRVYGEPPTVDPACKGTPAPDLKDEVYVNGFGEIRTPGWANCEKITEAGSVPAKQVGS